MDREKRKPGRPRSLVDAHKRSFRFPTNLYAKLEDIARQKEYSSVNDLLISVLREFVDKERQAA